MPPHAWRQWAGGRSGVQTISGGRGGEEGPEAMAAAHSGGGGGGGGGRRRHAHLRSGGGPADADIAFVSRYVPFMIASSMSWRFFRSSSPSGCNDTTHRIACGGAATPAAGSTPAGR